MKNILLFQNLYINPQNSAKSADGSHLTNVSDEEMQEHYDNFFEDVFVEAEDKYVNLFKFIYKKVHPSSSELILILGSSQVAITIHQKPHRII